MKVAVFGTTGMLGHAVIEVLSQNGVEVLDVNRNQIDAEISSVEQIRDVVSECKWIVNCIGIIKTYIHDNNAFETERAIRVNALFPYNLSKAAEKSRIIQIATDCVYDGQRGLYVETDPHNATDIYGKTKSLGEVSSDNVMNLRCSIIGRELKNKVSLLEWFLNQSRNAKVNGYTNHMWNGLTTKAFARICFGIIKNNFWFNGLQHVIPTGVINKAEMLSIFKKIFDRSDIIINNMQTEIKIDRTISTNNQERNQILWKLSGYEIIPTIKEMIEVVDVI